MIERLPDFVWTLYNLLFLNLGGCSELEELPREVRNLVKLRSLSTSTKQKRLPDEGIGSLGSLQDLSIVHCSKLEYLFEDAQHLSCLRSMEVSGCHQLISLPRDLKCLNTSEDLQIANCHQLIWKEEDDTQSIKLRLRCLTLEALPKVETLPGWVRKSSESLKVLKIRSCVNFALFPKWFQDFKSLEKIEIIGCPRLGERCKRLEGKDWHKIAHVPDIKIHI